LTAPHLLRARADTPYAEFPEGVHVDFYRNDGSLENVVIAKYAKHFETLGKVYLQDSVLVYTTLGDTLRTHSLWWDQNQEIYYTNDSVRINTLTQQLVGTGFWAKTNLSKYTITNTKGKVALPEQLDMAPAPVTTPLAQPGTAPVPPPANQP
ncbi:MAG TPA: LPS export ABC transporter periplasmic protein LptC, partial [Phnomibacter sp.]|nr:LPS export ABC transporter periplasmic protein LptC [Phnomibacter sp.]